jgi:hypothetical protein
MVALLNPLIGRCLRSGQLPLFTFCLLTANFMRLIKKLDAPKTVIVDPIEWPIPVRGGISIQERIKIDELVKEKGEASLDEMIRTIATETAKHNGNDPVKIATQLIEYRKVRGQTFIDDPVADYRGYFLIHCRDEFGKFEEALRGNEIDRYELAAAVYVLLKRIQKNEEFDPAKLKITDLLDPEFLPFSVLQELYNLYLVENSGRDINEFLNDKGEFRGEYGRKKTEEAKDAQPVVEEKVEAIAGK